MSGLIIATADDKMSAQKRNILNKILDSLEKSIGRNNNDEKLKYDNSTGFIRSIKQVQSTQTKKYLQKVNRKDSIIRFYEWATKNHAKFDGVEISNFPEFDYGLKATKKIKKDEVFIAVPKKMHMSLDQVDELEEFVEVLNRFHSTYEDNEMSTSRLAMFLIIEKLKEDSFWGPYIDILPNEYTTVFYFEEEDFKFLEEFVGFKGEYASAFGCWRQVTLDYITLYRLIHRCQKSSETIDRLKEYFTYELYCWAISTVMTRQNRIPIKKYNQHKKCFDVNMYLALIPFWDMANHKNGTITTFYDIENDLIESSTMEDYEINEQIFIYYGNRSNSEFMIHNGFVPLDNLENAFHLVYPLQSVQQDRLKLLSTLDIKEYWGRYPIRPSPNFISPKLLALIRIKEMTKEQLKHWISTGSKEELLNIDCQLNVELEEKVWKFLLTLLKTYGGDRETLMKLTERLEKHKNGIKSLSNTYLMILQHLIIIRKIILDSIDFVCTKLDEIQSTKKV